MLFLYKDAQGLVTRRSVPQPNEDDFYIRGYCEESKGQRTFRKDRIQGYFEEDGGLSRFKKAAAPDPSQRHKYRRPDEFTDLIEHGLMPEGWHLQEAS